MITVEEIEIDMLVVERRDALQGSVLWAWLEQRVSDVRQPNIFHRRYRCATRCQTLRTSRPYTQGLNAIARKFTPSSRNIVKFAGHGDRWTIHHPTTLSEIVMQLQAAVHDSGRLLRLQKNEVRFLAGVWLVFVK